MRIAFGKIKTNQHGTEKKGEPWNKVMRRGPMFKLVKLEGFDNESRLRCNIGKRLIFYFPDGSWWHLDIYKRINL